MEMTFDYLYSCSSLIAPIIRSYGMKGGSDSPATENQTKENAAYQLQSRAKSVIKLGIKCSCSNFYS